MNQHAIINDRLLPPVELCAYALQTRQVNEFKVYVYLKVICSGKLHEDDVRFQEAWRHLFKSKKTFKKHLQTLLRLNWVGYNPNSGIYFIRGYDFLRLKHSLTKSKTGVEFNTDYFKNFRQFLSGAVIGQRNNWHWFKKQKSERNLRGRSKQTSTSTSPIRSGVSNGVIADMFKISRSRACQVKQDAAKAGFITAQKQFAPTSYPVELVRSLRTTLDPQEARRLRIIGKTIFVQHYDAIDSHLRYAKRRRDKAICSLKTA